MIARLNIVILYRAIQIDRIAVRLLELIQMQRAVVHRLDDSLTGLRRQRHIPPETARDLERDIIQRVLARLDARLLLPIRLRRDVPTRASLCFGVRRQWIGFGFPMHSSADASSGLSTRTSSFFADLALRAVRVLLALRDYTPEGRKDCRLS